MISYEDSAAPPIAIAPAGFSLEDTRVWVRDNGEPMMRSDGGHHYMMVFRNHAGQVVYESQPFWHITDKHEAATAMRRLLESMGTGTT